jgi:hypothetical protein
VRRETGRKQKVQVLHGEGVAIHTGPESCAGRREATREALTGERIGQPLSGEIPIIRSADALVPAEGNMVGHAIASARPAPRRLRPWHVRTSSSAREPGGLRIALGHRAWGRTGKAGGRIP